MGQALIYLATIRYLDINPVSFFSMFTIALCAFAAFAISRKVSQYHPARQWAAIVIAQLIVLFIADDIRLTRSGADVDFAIVVSLSFGFGFCLSGMRGRSIHVSFISLVTGALFICLMGIAMLKMLETIFSDRRYSVSNVELMTLYLAPLILATLWLISGSFLVPKLRSPAIRAMRESKRNCPGCDYSLRGTPSSSPCPECGETIDWSNVVISEEA